MKEKGMQKKEIEALLQEKKGKDCSYSRVLSSMCTYPNEIAIYAHHMFLEANLGDSGLFLGTKEMEEEVIRMISSFLGNEKAAGYISTGGTESNIQAIRAIRNKQRGEEKGNDRLNIVVPESAHFSFDKIADILRIEMKKVPLDKDLKVDVKMMEEMIDEKTIAMVGIAGTTEFGQIDPIEELSEIACERGVDLHVDAAFGGFVIPFLEKKYKFDFSIDGVSSISIDPHKMGMSTIPSGCILFREESYLEALSVSTPYLTTKTQYSLTGTRSGASAAATYAVLKYLGKEGLKKIVDNCMRLTGILVKKAKELGVSTVIEPVMNVVALKFELSEVERIKEELEKKGWRVSTTRKPKALRLVIMPHVNDESLKMFLEDLEDVLS